MAAAPDNARGEQSAFTTSADVVAAVRDFNESNQAHEDLWARVHQAGDAVSREVEEKTAVQLRARQARDFFLAVQAEYPHRRAHLPQQVLLAAFTIGLDAVACWFAAQALDSSPAQTLVWTVLFLAVLAGGEIALDHFSERNGRAWRLLAVSLMFFVAGLGFLRFEFLATVGTNSVTAALVGAALFTAATAGFLVIGYRALRAAERFPAWQARRAARHEEREAMAASHRVARRLRERNRLIDAYLSRIRVGLVKTCSSDQLPQVEAALRTHLTGRDPS